MASGKRITAVILVVLAFLLTVTFVGLLFAKSVNDTAFKFAQDIPSYALYVGVGLGIIIIILFMLILVRSSEERRNIQAESDEEARRREEEERARQFESTLGEPDGLGKGPEMVVYNLAALPAMYRAYERMNRRTKMAQYTFPRSVESAIYSTERIEVGQGITLKLRILIAGPKDGTKKPLDPLNLKPSPVIIDPKSVPEPWRSRLTGETPPAPAPEPEALPPPSLEEMEAHFNRNGAPRSNRAYYDYTGHVHPVEDIEGIGRIYGDKLRAAGVVTTARLAYEDPDELAERVGVPRKTVETWQAMAELVKVNGIGPQFAEALARAGMQGIADLKRRKADAIADQVNAYLDSLETTVVASRITTKRVEGWQKAAANLRRVRLKVPAE